MAHSVSVCLLTSASHQPQHSFAMNTSPAIPPSFSRSWALYKLTERTLPFSDPCPPIGWSLFLTPTYILAIFTGPAVCYFSMVLDFISNLFLPPSLSCLLNQYNYNSYLIIICLSREKYFSQPLLFDLPDCCVISCSHTKSFILISNISTMCPDMTQSFHPLLVPSYLMHDPSCTSFLNIIMLLISFHKALYIASTVSYIFT